MGDFIKPSIKAVRADDPLLCLLKGFIMTASNCSAHAVFNLIPAKTTLSTEKVPLCNWFSGGVFFCLLCVIVRLYMCVSYWGEEIKATVGNTKIWRVLFCVCFGQLVLLRSGVVKFSFVEVSSPVCGAVM